MSASPYSRLPQLDRLLKSPGGEHLIDRYLRARVVEALRVVLEEARDGIRTGHTPPEDEESYLHAAERRLEWQSRPSLRRVINATGIVLHTNLGRSVLAPAAIQAVIETGAGHSNLEMDLETGERGSRQTHVASILRRLTGAEDAAVFNNNAGAVFLALTALAQGREVIVSRGQLVEIGGAFRIPDIIGSGGARLVEVGTTNRTRLDDYRRAVTPETALLLKVHPSNYRIVGFQEEVSGAALASLGHELGIPVMEDLGSGALVDLRERGIGAEPHVRESVEAGLDLIAFSGDKLLGGPQAGIVVGRKELVNAVKRHPLARALRCDKMTLAALEATLRLYEHQRAWEEIPTLRSLTRSEEEIRERAERIASTLVLPLRAEVIPGISQVGGGSLPGEQLPTYLLSLTADGISDADLARRLRLGSPPVAGRTQGGRVLLDLRTVEPEEETDMAAALEAIRADLL